MVYARLPITVILPLDGNVSLWRNEVLRFYSDLVRSTQIWSEARPSVVSWKFHFARQIFILNWALAGETERKKCKKLQFRARDKIMLRIGSAMATWVTGFHELHEI